MTLTYSGQCLCGAVTYAINGAPVIVAQCHCDQCRRLSGTGHTIGAMFQASDVTINGALGEFSYTSSLGSTVTKSFCPTCASPICGANTRSLDHVTIPLGSMDNGHGLAVQVVIFKRDKQHWDELGPDVMQFETQPDWTPKG